MLLRLFTLFFTMILQAGLLYGQSNIQVGEKAPAVQVTDWIANVPDDKSLDDKYIVLEFWATWCGPCIQAVPHMNELQETFKDRENLYFISITDESREKVGRTLQKVPFQSIVVTDESRSTHVAFGDGEKGLESYPLTVLIDNQGVVRWIGEPFDLTEPVLSGLLSGTLTGASSSAGPDGGTGKNEAGIEIESGEENGFKTFLSLVKDKDVLRFFELKRTESDLGTRFRISDLGMYLEGVRLDELYAELSGISKGRIEVPEKMQDARYQLTWKRVDKAEGKVDQLRTAVVESLGLQAVEEKRTVDVYLVRIADPSRLEPTLENNQSTSEAGDLLILKKHTVTSMLDALGEYPGYRFEYQGDKDNVEYDLILNISSPEKLTGSLRDYGFTVEKTRKEMEFTTFVGSEEEK